MPCTTTCGDGIKTGTEQCDDGNTTAGDGCDTTCNTEPGWTCTGSTPTVCVRNPVCGNGSVESGEACDDGNTHNGDGCSSVCTVEPGFTCIGSPSVCHHGGCGDSIVQGTEQCDGGPCCNVPGCTFKPDGTTCDDAGNTCLVGVCQSSNPGGIVNPPGTGPMAIEGGGFCSLVQNASDANAFMMVLLDFIGAASIGLVRLRKTRRRK
jgi:cysteine-rich repeat protein